MNLSNVFVTELRRIDVKGGDVMHAIKKEDLQSDGFGEAYFSWISAGAIKAWKRHLRMTMNLVVPVGNVRFVFRAIDAFGVDQFRVEEIGENCYARITVPPGIWFGFQGMGKAKSLILNVANIPHDPQEVERVGLAEINYDWIDR